MEPHDFIKFQFTLPYPIRIPFHEHFLCKLDNHEVVFIHDERFHTSTDRGIHFNRRGMIPADKYGIMARSRIRLLCPMSFIRESWLEEDGETKSTFPENELERYVVVTFGTFQTRLLRKVIEAANFILAKYRILCGDWHIIPIVPKDVVNWKIYRLREGREDLIAVKTLASQVFNTQVEVSEKTLQLFRQALQIPQPFMPLNILEADIHDKITQKDYIPAVVLTALLCEESIKGHLVCIYMHRDCISNDVAIEKLKNSSGRTFGIAQLVEKPKRQCVMAQETDWVPYDTEEYRDWDTNVRRLRNDIVHVSKLRITDQQMKACWESAAAFVSRSKQECLKALHKHGVPITQQIVATFFCPINPKAGVSGIHDQFIETE